MPSDPVHVCAPSKPCVFCLIRTGQPIPASALPQTLSEDELRLVALYRHSTPAQRALCVRLLDSFTTIDVSRPSPLKLAPSPTLTLVSRRAALGKTSGACALLAALLS